MMIVSPFGQLGLWPTKEYSRNIRGTFGEHSDDDSKPVWPTWAVANRGIFGEHAGNMQ
jgi:hypothetical protein